MKYDWGSNRRQKAEVSGQHGLVLTDAWFVRLSDGTNFRNVKGGDRVQACFWCDECGFCEGYMLNSQTFMMLCRRQFKIQEYEYKKLSKMPVRVLFA